MCIGDLDAKCQVNFNVDGSLCNVLGFSRKIYKAGRHESDNLVNILSVNPILVHCDIIEASRLNGIEAPHIYNFFPDVAPMDKIVSTPLHLIYIPFTLNIISHMTCWLTDQNGKESARWRTNNHVSVKSFWDTEMYTSTKVTVFEDQHDKLNAIVHQKPISVKLDLGHSGGGGKHTLRLTRSQIARIERSRLIGKSNVTIHLSKRQVKANVQHQGDFLDMLARLAAKTLPSILGGLATGLVSGAVRRVVMVYTFTRWDIVSRSILFEETRPNYHIQLWFW